MPNNVLTPVTRNHKFYSQKDFEFETGLMADYIDEDVGMTIVLYQVDRERTMTDEVYKETGKVFYKMPVELPCIYDLSDSVLKTYDSKTANGAYTITGNLRVDILVQTLEENSCEISRGDYIGVLVDTNRMAYFVVVDDGKLNTSNRLHIGAFRPAWRTISASPVTDLEFNG